MNHQLRSRIAVTGAVLGVSLGSAGIATASAATKAPTLSGLTQAAHLIQHSAATPADGGLSGLLQNLSQVKGIQGTQFGDDLSSLAADSANEDGVAYANEVAGLHKIQAESASFPAPFNTLFFNLAGVFLKNIPSSSSTAAHSTTSTNLLSTLTGVLKSL